MVPSLASPRQAPEPLGNDRQPSKHHDGAEVLHASKVEVKIRRPFSRAKTPDDHLFVTNEVVPNLEITRRIRYSVIASSKWARHWPPTLVELDMAPAISINLRKFPVRYRCAGPHRRVKRHVTHTLYRRPWATNTIEIEHDLVIRVTHHRNEIVSKVPGRRELTARHRTLTSRKSSMPSESPRATF